MKVVTIKEIIKNIIAAEILDVGGIFKSQNFKTFSSFSMYSSENLTLITL